MAKCSKCGVSNQIISEHSALQTYLNEAQSHIDYLERDRAERWADNQVDLYRPYQRPNTNYQST